MTSVSYSVHGRMYPIDTLRTAAKKSGRVLERTYQVLFVLQTLGVVVSIFAAYVYNALESFAAAYNTYALLWRRREAFKTRSLYALRKTRARQHAAQRDALCGVYAGVYSAMRDAFVVIVDRRVCTYTSRVTLVANVRTPDGMHLRHARTLERSHTATASFSIGKNEPLCHPCPRRIRTSYTPYARHLQCMAEWDLHDG